MVWWCDGMWCGGVIRFGGVLVTWWCGDKILGGWDSSMVIVIVVCFKLRFWLVDGVADFFGYLLE